MSRSNSDRKPLPNLESPSRISPSTHIFFIISRLFNFLITKYVKTFLVISVISWFLRIFAELKVISSLKAKNYLNHEEIGLNVLENIDDMQVVIDLYKNDLLNSRHKILDKTDY